MVAAGLTMWSQGGGVCVCLPSGMFTIQQLYCRCCSIINSFHTGKHQMKSTRWRWTCCFMMSSKSELRIIFRMMISYERWFGTLPWLSTFSFADVLTVFLYRHHGVMSWSLQVPVDPLSSATILNQSKCFIVFIFSVYTFLPAAGEWRSDSPITLMISAEVSLALMSLVLLWCRSPQKLRLDLLVHEVWSSLGVPCSDTWIVHQVASV